MLGYLLEGKPLFGLELQDLLDEIFYTLREFGVNLIAALHHRLLNFLYGLALEWSGAMQKFI